MSIIRAKTLALLTTLLMLAAWSGHGAAEGLTAAGDLRDLDPDQPVILAFTADDCPYCEYVKESHLVPMRKRGEAVTIREVDVGSHRNLTTFAGETVKQRDLGDGYSVRVTPTLVFLTPEGDVAAENLVGVTSRDYYGLYLERRVESVREAMAGE
ncbi:Thioredoxin-like domain-containing protein [Thiohalospira halophila DSM 15071]|uniref:Thioredoxin-like domain-containing protein n=1 Tax=Thiohalospira halophila DSM 15071 TaxID=1123397 RepID=A0A1I1VE56_9GAMM|nr:thioredoxin fold domain-containing protein [Thiohalospira halophila]SFD81226.1 Thioredoxin-like domain-containing protein [Thiohalospira halophila DSM 15071]